ncbi:hypothetical protein HN789_03830 [archaeon]|jgi:hypothetical protein|nr:hypothetical protein [archaeon]MBT4023093.1 hypothetical protein [archaeon]MBT4272491.1 hypothetical protein [archaeon]MBT4460589.1 hypothetical protein [archaeon]MBT4857821.1 hypothetical protein [archaeon]
MTQIQSVNKKEGGSFSLPKGLPSFKTNIPNSLPSLTISTNKNYEKEIPFFPEEESYNEPPALPILNNFPANFQKKGPLFVRTDDYSKMISCVDTMQEYIKESPEIIMMLKNLEKNSEIEFKSYLKNLEDIQRKLIYIDNLLFEAMK